MAVTKKDDFLETAFDLGQWFETHWRSVLRGAGIFVLAAVVIAAVFGWRQQRVKQATRALESGTAAFNRSAASQFSDIDALADALVFFEKAEAKAGGSAPGPLATYYRGVTLHRLGRADEATEALERFVGQASGESPLDWAGRALLAQLHADAGDSARAIALLEEVIGEDSAYPVEQALLQLGLVQQSTGDAAAARRSWQRIVDEYAATSSARQARELLGS
ncbi:MAG: tetratricopeptide repeat protein [Acidobacteria bacterium]|nr:tetratricopeptide repeat protein [Acidobacteriota bacterium]NIM63798.1 tetratricopeptide repeat protein [Acidobacteriota bacterium]NIO58461.1 tetratricopeptide repeat protein [Acidobacteriota bacterium]NIQ29524.1 tetratricopeptide repeat protein [Acidobacteriota bacterium]NIQ84206.1 tetratricopeptide repeat protein [Acidobacteriota bacterium]